MGWWMGLWWLLILAVIVAVALMLRPRDRKARSALDILDERFARGEIDADEYRERRDELRG